MDSRIYRRAAQIIRSLYGPGAGFRQGQYEAIEAVLTHRKTLVVQKTGWGKSLVYFVCTKILREQGRGLTLVVSPLTALMDNQSEAAVKLGLRCAVLNSSTRARRLEQIAQMRAGQVDIAFITPETLFSQEVQDNLPSIPLGLFVVDEVHCISDWGHDFRLEYTRLNRVIRNMPRTVPVLGTTATANDRVIEDLKTQFGEDVYISRGPLMRRSLSIQILRLPTAAQRYAWLLQNIPKLPGSGIVYCLTQRDCEDLARFLRKNGILAQAYHAGLEQEETALAEERLRENRIKALIATVKLGMGYDKGDISFVVHYQQPSNIVAYYQQIGRAGRNIDRAYTFLMCGEEDAAIQDYFIETAFPTEREAREVYDAVLANAGTGLSRWGVESQVNIRGNRVEKALMFLSNEGQILREGGKYYPTLRPFRYRREHYEEITAVRRREQAQMRQLTETAQCLNRFVVNCLDDPETEDCGICQNCLGTPQFPERPDELYIQKAQAYLEGVLIPIEPRKRLAGGGVIPVPNQPGICLSKYGHPGYGEMVRQGKYGASPGFCEKLVLKSADVLRPVVRRLQIDAVTCVPSLRGGVVPDFARRLAARLGIPFLTLLAKTAASHQKEMQNSSFQFRNAWNSFSLRPGAQFPGRILLVDDIVDSRWTMTVCGYLLTQAGCGIVFPFALADSSENRRQQD